MGCVCSKRFSCREGRRESSPQFFTVTGLGREYTQAETVYATGIHHETTINEGSEEPLKLKLRSLEIKMQTHQQQLIERESKIRQLENDIKQQQDEAKSKDTSTIQDQIDHLNEKVNMHKSEIARLENEVLPDLLAQRDEVKEQLEKHEKSAQGKMEELPVLNGKLQKLTEDLKAYGTDVTREREKVEHLFSEISSLKKDFEKVKSDQHIRRTEVRKIMTELETIKTAQAEQTQDLQDEMRKQRELTQQVAKQHEKLRNVQNKLEEEKMAREAAERKIQKLQERGMETSQASDDLKTRAYQHAGGEAEQHGVMSDPSLSMTVPLEDDSSTSDSDDFDQRASTDPSLSTTVPPVTVTTQDSDQHATPSEASGRLLWDACDRGDLETVRRIVAGGHADVNYRGGRWSRTPVMKAAWSGHRDVVEFLVGEGADTSLVDDVGDNILHYACMGVGDLETVKLILSLDVVDVNARDNNGRTAADVARHVGHQRVLNLLVSRGGAV